MIPRLTLKETLPPDYLLFLEALEKSPFAGEIRPDFASRLLMSTDNSIYQILPQAVVFPKTEADLVHLFSLADRDPFKTIKFSPRGGGTGTNGQSLSPGIIIDCSKYMNQILELNLEAGWVRVQPGVILDQLNAYLQPHGVFFAPCVAPSNRATIGGMVNTDACGKGSRIYGRTSNHLLELAWVLADGTRGRSHPLDRPTLEGLKQQPDRLGGIYRQVEEIVVSKRDLIENNFPKIPRFMTGYNLAKVCQEEAFNLNWILAGSEGTLAVITEAKLKLTPLPKFKQLLALHYDGFDAALSAAGHLLKFDPAAIETIDEKILDLAKEETNYDRVKDFIGDARAINLDEFTGVTLEEIQHKIHPICQEITSGLPPSQPARGYYLAQSREEIARLWELRQKGVGLLGNLRGERKPVAFIEDTAVPTSQLASYVRDLKTLLEENRLDYAMYGHVDVGCLHLRPALDLKEPEDEALIRHLSDRVVSLVRQYGGVLWGEHGKGFRSEYTPAFFGELTEDLGKIKAAFDPDNRLNPGKIVTPSGSSEAVVTLEAPLRGHFDRQVPPPVRTDYEGAFSCNGNGACFNFNPDEVMCPSSKVTRDRIHSPKGRATLLREWLRQLSHTPEGSGEEPASFLGQLWQAGRKARGVYDFSHEVYQAMDGCLSCKACASQCPIHVDIPEMKAKFLHRYHTRYLRPWRDYWVAQSETLARWQSRAPRLANALTQNPVAKWGIRQFLGLIDPPAASSPTLRQGLKERRAPEADLARLSELSEAARQDSVILLQDAFTSFYEAQLVLDTYDFLNRLGYTVYVPSFFPSGKPLHVKGFLGEFQAIAAANAAYLQKLGNSGLPLLGIEPSITLTYGDEYGQISDLKTSLPKVHLLQAFLLRQRERLRRISKENPTPPSPPPTYFLLSHCTEQALAPTSAEKWQQVFQEMGIPLILVPTGCCGMAGIYGHEAKHLIESHGIYQMSWGRQIAALPEARQYWLATGYSCRSQVERFEGFVPKHPVQALLQEACRF